MTSTLKPRFNVSEILKLRASLTTALLVNFLDSEPTLEEFELFVRIFADEVRIEYDIAWNSLRYLLNTKLTHEVLEKAIWQMAGNSLRLRAGEVVGPWVGQPVLEWIPLHIVEMSPERRGDLRGWKCRGRILAGSPVGQTASRFMPSGLCRMLAVRAGYSRGGGKYPYRNPIELTNLRITGLVKPSSCSIGRIEFDKIYVTSSQLSHNRDVIKFRFRVGSKCPHDYTHECFRCPVGYRDCPGGCHLPTYTYRACSVCGKSRALFNLGQTGQCCIVCEPEVRLNCGPN